MHITIHFACFSIACRHPCWLRLSVFVTNANTQQKSLFIFMAFGISFRPLSFKNISSFIEGFAFFSQSWTHVRIPCIPIYHFAFRAGLLFPPFIYLHLQVFHPQLVYLIFLHVEFQFCIELNCMHWN